MKISNFTFRATIRKRKANWFGLILCRIIEGKIDEE
jgi:hypothetical protein